MPLSSLGFELERVKVLITPDDYDNIGFTVNKQDGYFIVTEITGSAEDAGVRLNDFVVQINNIELLGSSLREQDFTLINRSLNTPLEFHLWRIDCRIGLTHLCIPIDPFILKTDLTVSKLGSDALSVNLIKGKSKDFILKENDWIVGVNFIPVDENTNLSSAIHPGRTDPVILNILRQEQASKEKPKPRQTTVTFEDQDDPKRAAHPVLKTTLSKLIPRESTTESVPIQVSDEQFSHDEIFKTTEEYDEALKLYQSIRYPESVTTEDETKIVDPFKLRILISKERRSRLLAETEFLKLFDAVEKHVAGV